MSDIYSQIGSKLREFRARSERSSATNRFPSLAYGRALGPSVTTDFCRA